MPKKGTSMILCFYRQEVETFKEKHKIIDVPFSTPVLILDEFHECSGFILAPIRAKMSIDFQLSLIDKIITCSNS